MSSKVLYDGGAKTQSAEAVENLSRYLGRPIDGGVLDLGDAKLVKSSKGDVFYTVTAKSCSCPSASWRPGKACKHMRRYFATEAMGSSPGIPSSQDLMPSRRGFRPTLEDTLAGERSMLGDSPGRVDLSEPVEAV